MVDVVVVVMAVVVAIIFAISAWAAVIIFRKGRRGADTGPPDNWRSSGLFGRGGRSGSDISTWTDGSSGSGSAGS